MSITSRIHLFKVQRGVCAYCRQSFNIEELNIDHVIPVSLGGLNIRGNKVLSCFPCNTAKGNRLPTKEELIFANKMAIRLLELVNRPANYKKAKFDNLTLRLEQNLKMLEIRNSYE